MRQYQHFTSNATMLYCTCFDLCCYVLPLQHLCYMWDRQQVQNPIPSRSSCGPIDKISSWLEQDAWNHKFGTGNKYRTQYCLLIDESANLRGSMVLGESSKWQTCFVTCLVSIVETSIWMHLELKLLWVESSVSITPAATVYGHHYIVMLDSPNTRV